MPRSLAAFDVLGPDVQGRSVASASRGDVAGTFAAPLGSVINFRCRRFTSIAKFEA